MARKEFFSSDKERVDFVAYEVDRLYFAMDRSTSEPIPVIRTETSGENDGKTIQVGVLSPREQQRIKAKTIWSYREEMAMIGEEELADHIIFQPDLTMKEAGGKNEGTS